MAPFSCTSATESSLQNSLSTSAFGRARGLPPPGSLLDFFLQNSCLISKLVPANCSWFSLAPQLLSEPLKGDPHKVSKMKSARGLMSPKAALFR